jgi:hypothetical protein
MKNIVKSIVLIAVLVLVSSCSPSLNVLNSWTEKGDNNLSGKNVLVITKVKDKTARIESEEAITSQLSASNIKAKSSFKIFSMLDPNRKLNKEEVEDAVKKIKEKGYNAIVLTTLKDYDETRHTEQSGGYYAGGSYYGSHYRGFGSYYGRVYSSYDRGVYVPSETKTFVSKKYILETVTYDLDLPKDKELISVTTIEVEDPEDLESITKQYAKAVVSRILKN